VQDAVSDAAGSSCCESVKAVLQVDTGREQLIMRLLMRFVELWLLCGCRASTAGPKGYSSLDSGHRNGYMAVTPLYVWPFFCGGVNVCCGPLWLLSAPQRRVVVPHGALACLQF